MKWNNRLKQPAKKLTKDEIAVKLIKQLDGISIQQAKDALTRAQALLDTTQIVSAESPRLTSAPSA